MAGLKDETSILVTEAPGCPFTNTTGEKLHPNVLRWLVLNWVFEKTKNSHKMIPVLFPIDIFI